MAHLDVVPLGQAQSAFRTEACRGPVVRTDAPLVVASCAEACPVPVVVAALAQSAVRGQLACLTGPLHCPFLHSHTYGLGQTCRYPPLGTTGTSVSSGAEATSDRLRGWCPVRPLAHPLRAGHQHGVTSAIAAPRLRRNTTFLNA